MRPRPMATPASLLLAKLSLPAEGLRARVESQFSASDIQRGFEYARSAFQYHCRANTTARRSHENAPVATR